MTDSLRDEPPDDCCCGWVPGDVIDELVPGDRVFHRRTARYGEVESLRFSRWLRLAQAIVLFDDNGQPRGPFPLLRSGLMRLPTRSTTG